MQVAGSAVATCIADILSVSSERKLSWLEGGTEVYVYAKGGAVTSCVPKIEALAGSSDHYLVGFSFGSTRTKLYKASDDTTLWGS